MDDNDLPRRMIWIFLIVACGIFLVQIFHLSEVWNFMGFLSLGVFSYLIFFLAWNKALEKKHLENSLTVRELWMNESKVNLPERVP